MASVMIICGGLVKPKSENVKKPLVLLLFFEGSKHGKERFVIWVGLGEIGGEDFSARRGGHFHKTNEKMMPKYKKWSLNHVGYVKMSPT